MVGWILSLDCDLAIPELHSELGTKVCEAQTLSSRSPHVGGEQENITTWPPEHCWGKKGSRGRGEQEARGHGLQRLAHPPLIWPCAGPRRVTGLTGPGWARAEFQGVQKRVRVRPGMEVDFTPRAIDRHQRSS